MIRPNDSLLKKRFRLMLQRVGYLWNCQRECACTGEQWHDEGGRAYLSVVPPTQFGPGNVKCGPPGSRKVWC